MAKSSTLPTEVGQTGYVRQSQLIPYVVPFSSSTLWRMVKAGKFPQPVKLSERVTAWRVEDIRAWMQSRTTA
jgi:predicted DNA-binding transcriptional regulator AlpA